MATLGKILFWGSGIILYLLSIYSYYLWFGGLGALAALIVPPLAELFPFVYLFLVGFTPEFLHALDLLRGTFSMCPRRFKPDFVMCPTSRGSM